jgi:regulator of protease activity HflC (stomatin/prohibitin superfamily)
MFKEIKQYVLVTVLGLVGLGVLVFGSGFCFVQYKLWRADYAGRTLEIERKYKGKAILAEAEHARKARVEAAKAEKEAAKLTAEAIQIVGEAAQKYPEYRQQEFYLSLGDALKEGKISQIIYLPTEAGMPITEAGKR